MVGLFGRPDPNDTQAPKSKPKAEKKEAAPKKAAKKKSAK